MKTGFIVGLVAVSLAHSISAFASPSIGDFIRVEGTMSGKAIAMETELKAYDSAKGLFKQFDATFVAGQPYDSQEHWVREAGLPTPKDIDLLLSMCNSSGGRLERITVPAGDFDTCRLPTNEGKGIVHMGKVPFGVVKYWKDQSDPKSLKMSLVRFRYGR